MAEEYKQGMVSQLLGGGQEPSGGKLASLFTVPAAPADTESKKPKTTCQKKRAMAADSSFLPPVKKVKAQAEKAEAPMPTKQARRHRESKSERKVQKMKEMGLKHSAPSEGFNPPPGIVHEAVAAFSGKSQWRRTKLVESDIEDSVDELVKKGIKEDRRPRRDRDKKAAQKRTIFIGNVPLTVDKKKLCRLFMKFGEIESLRFRCAPIADPATKKRVAVIKKEFHEKRHNIAAYICFKEAEAAKKALEVNGHMMEGFHLRVDSAKPMWKNVTNRSVFVGNLPFSIEEESIRQHFEDCGEVENVRVVRDRKTNLGKGFCYVLFKSSDSVSLALQLNNSVLEKRKLRVGRCVHSRETDSEKNKPKKLGGGKHTSTGPKQKQENRDWQVTKNRQTDSDGKAKRRKKMWQPTNASALQICQSQKTALKKKQHRGEKKRKQRSKTEKINRVLGPAPQVSVNGGTKKVKPKRKDLKGGKKGKKGVS